MNTVFFDHFEVVLDRALKDDRAELEPAHAMISPWATWLLLALIRHETRQNWVGKIVKENLGGDPEMLAKAGSFGHPPIKQSGLVPGLTDWNYFFHGRGCCLTHRVTGESIDVDFLDDTAHWIDTWFYGNYLKSLKQPEFIEARVIRMHMSGRTYDVSADELTKIGALDEKSKGNLLLLNPRCREWAGRVDRLNEMGAQTSSHARLGAAIGDWLLVRLNNPGDPQAQEHEKECIVRRRAWIDEWEKTGFAPTALAAKGELPGPELDAALRAALRGPLDGSISIALELLGARKEEDWSTQVLEVFRRVSPQGEIPQPNIFIGCADYLLRRNKQVDVVRTRLMEMKNRELGRAAVLALEFIPDLARQLFAKALRSKIPIDREVAAAALALVDQPWSHMELLSALEYSSDQEATSECRAALLAMPHTQLHAAVAEWEKRHPHTPEKGPFITGKEMMLRTRSESIQWQMEQLHDRIIPIRNRPLPPSQPRRKNWWSF